MKKKKHWNGILSSALFLSLIGIMFIYSVEVSQSHRNLYYIKQLVSLVLAIFVYAIVSRWSYHIYADLSLWVYLGGLALLVFVLLFGMRINGAKSWVNLGFYNGQLAEFAKLTFILSFAHIMTQYQEHIQSRGFFLLSVLFLAPYIALLIIQPDFGTAVIFVFIFFIMFFVGGGNIEVILFVIPVAILSIAIPFLGFYLHTVHPNSYWSFLVLSSGQIFVLAGIFGILTAIFFTMHLLLGRVSSYVILLAGIILSLSFFGAGVFKVFLRDYHYERILVTLEPGLDPEKKGYNLEQSLISIGGGKILGYGLTKGPQNRGHFLPASHTDFILSVIAEEWGFVGVIIVIALYVILIYQLAKIAMNTRDRFGFLVVVGVGGLFASHILINILSIVGVLPIIGIPLPFLSYGGSFIMGCFIALGIVNNIRGSRYNFTNFNG